MFDVEEEKDSGEGLDVVLVTNIDLVPSTKRPPRGGSSVVTLGVTGGL